MGEAVRGEGERGGEGGAQGEREAAGTYLRLMEGQDPLEHRDNGRRNLRQQSRGEARLGPPTHGGVVDAEVLAQHMQAKGDEAELGGGADEEEVLGRAERRRLALLGEGRAWRELLEEGE